MPALLLLVLVLGMSVAQDLSLLPATRAVCLSVGAVLADV
jgi:hypothetical protein